MANILDSKETAYYEPKLLANSAVVIFGALN